MVWTFVIASRRRRRGDPAANALERIGSAWMAGNPAWAQFEVGNLDPTSRWLDCFATLAMTVYVVSPKLLADHPCPFYYGLLNNYRDRMGLYEDIKKMFLGDQK